MIQRLLQLITNRLRHWRSDRGRRDRSHKHARPQSTAPHSPEHITYTLSRSEAVTALNHTLKHGKIDRAQRSAAQFSHKADTTNTTPEDEQPDLIESLADSAYLCECQGRLGEAEQLYKQAVALSIRQFGEAHLETAPHLSNLAKLYFDQQRYAQAQPLLEQALTIQQQYQTFHYPEKGETLYQLANIYHHQEDYSKAESLYQQALSTFRQVFGLNHVRTQAVYGELMQMLTMIIASGQFETLTAKLPPLDLDTLGDTYSWAKPDWMKNTPPGESYSWIKLQSPSKDTPQSRL